MDLFFCIPLIFGCQTRISHEGDQTPRICPRCHNAAVNSAKSKQFFEFCFVPLVPMSSKHIWMCAICHWSVPRQQGWEPQPVTSVPVVQPRGYYPPHSLSGWSGQPNYNPHPQSYQPGPGQYSTSQN
ncbi:hypothetical protein GALMADRAFT_239394 [Galerina marginata CBS 339.88]|uniref:Zinc-ribbon 15 domain-containing protein n=1 Tax=Galerina marginata (strain CBS 339.88) TaxID=685588 RepID=A0A067TRA1_GALM3|nr:hypothetical protein GALMADRAFT_239394 [Galerina marginata CBS 339.88]